MRQEPSIYISEEDVYHLPPPIRKVVGPSEGWKAHTLYLVLMSVSPSNPIHHSYLKVGFLTDEKDPKPAQYSATWDSTSSETEFHRLHYLRVLKKLHTEGEPI